MNKMSSTLTGYLLHFYILSIVNESHLSPHSSMGSEFLCGLWKFIHEDGNAFGSKRIVVIVYEQLYAYHTIRCMVHFVSMAGKGRTM